MKKILENHVIYGYWDDVSNYEFMVYYHPNGKVCTVFIMAGCDYGGGIGEYYEDIDAKSLDTLITSFGENYNSYELKLAVVDFCKGGKA